MTPNPLFQRARHELWLLASLGTILLGAPLNSQSVRRRSRCP